MYQIFTDPHTVRFLALGVTLWLLKKAITAIIRRVSRSRAAHLRVFVGAFLVLGSIGTLRAQEPTPTPGPSFSEEHEAHLDALLYVNCAILGTLLIGQALRRFRL